MFDKTKLRGDYFFIENDSAYPYAYTNSQAVINILEFHGLQMSEPITDVFIIDSDDAYGDSRLDVLAHEPQFKREILDTIEMMGNVTTVVLDIKSEKLVAGRSDFIREMDKFLEDTGD